MSETGTEDSVGNVLPALRAARRHASLAVLCTGVAGASGLCLLFALVLLTTGEWMFNLAIGLPGLLYDTILIALSMGVRRGRFIWLTMILLGFGVFGAAYAVVIAVWGAWAVAFWGALLPVGILGCLQLVSMMLLIRVLLVSTGDKRVRETAKGMGDR